MLLATTLRYMDLQKNTRFDQRFFTTKEYVTMAECYGFGLLAVMNEGGVAAAVSACDGLLLPGSSTPHPKEFYEGEPPERPIVWDEYPLDSALVRAFFEAGKPILGICGGEQTINVVFGGTLCRVPDLAVHMDMTLRSHPINIVEGSFIHEVFGATRYTVNSGHSWRVARLAPNFTVSATTDDGVVEAIEWRERHVFGVQWHPEKVFAPEEEKADGILLATPIERRIFELFLSECEACRQAGDR